MVDYSLDGVFYPGDSTTKLTVCINEGQYEGTVIRVDNFQLSEDDEMMEVEYTLLDGPKGVEEADEKLVEVFKVIMTDVLDKVIREAIEVEKEMEEGDK